MSQAGAKASRDLREMTAQMEQQRMQERAQEVGLRLEIHNRAVAATTEFTEKDGRTTSIPATPDEQMEYAQRLYDWATSKDED